MNKIKLLYLPKSTSQKIIELCQNFSKKRYNPNSDRELIENESRYKLFEFLEKTDNKEQKEAEKIYDCLFKIKKKKERISFLITNLPIDTVLPATPQKKNDFSNNGKGYISEFVSLIINSTILQKTISNDSIQNGNAIHNITPRLECELEESNRGSFKEFSLHTECSYLPEKKIPNYISLLCLKSGQYLTGVKTNIVFIEDLLEKLSIEDIRILEKPYFTFLSGKALDKNSLSSQSSIISYNKDGSINIRYNDNSDKLQAINSKAITTLIKVKNILNITKKKKNYGLILKPGMGIWINNKTALHGRTGFTPMTSPDPYARWIQRTHSLNLK